MIYDSRYIIYGFRKAGLSFLFFLLSIVSFSQISSEIDTTKIRIGEQISYTIKVEADTTKLVVFPEGQTFLPLEMVEATKIDTTKKTSKYEFLKTYKLTQFDSGAYYIPRQKIKIGDKLFFTDSLQVEVNTIAVDTTKQGLYDIKPIIKVEKSGSGRLSFILGMLFALALIAFILYWFIWRKKPLTEEEEIALLPPYDRAKIAIQKLENESYLERSELKKYYSELTFIIRKFLDEKVYDHSLESTSDELIARLQLLKDGNQLHFKNETIHNINTILKRADLVKFAKEKPDIALAEIDKQTIDKEIDAIKATFPEPSEEEKLLDQKYKEEQERKKKRRKILLTVGISIFLLAATLIGFGLKYGFGYVKDTILGHETKELLEGEWVKSAYGYPPIYIETPKVLKREAVKIKDSLNTEKESDFDAFIYGSQLSDYYMVVRSVPVKGEDMANLLVTNGVLTADQLKNISEENLKRIVLEYFSEAFLQTYQNIGAKDIVSLRDTYETPQEGIEGIKTYGTLTATNKSSKKEAKFSYDIYTFLENEAVQAIIFMYKKDDKYVPDILERILQSIRLKPIEEEPKKEK